MALIGQIAISMKVATTQFVKGLGDARKALGTFAGGPIRDAANQLGRFGAVAATVAGTGIWRLVKGAGDLSEQVNRADVMFGQFSANVQREANMMASAFGVSRGEFLASASALSGIFQAAGYDKSQAADLSVHFVKLATDLSSLANISVQEAMEKIQSGLAGEARPLREVGVFMSEAAIKAEALTMKMKILGGELTDQQTIQARVSFITRGLAFANGDLARTADSLQNSTRGLAGRMQMLAETIGQALEPVAQAVFGELNNAVAALSLYWEDSRQSVVNWAASAVGSVGETVQAMGWLQRSVGFVADAFQVLKIGFFAVQASITFAIGIIIKGFSSLAHALDFVVSKLTGIKSTLGDFIDTYGQDLDRLSGEQWKKFATELAKPPPSEGVNAYFAGAKKRIAEMRKEAVRTGVDVAKITPANMAPAKAEAPKFASAMAAGSKEATNAILRSRYGGAAGKGPAEATAKNTAKIAEILGKIGADILGGARAGADVAFAAGAGNF